MEILSQRPRKSDPARLVTARGRLVHVNLVLPIVAGRMPQWLETLLAPHMKRFAEDSWCPDYWMALTRLSFMKDWCEGWGSTPEQEWLVSSHPIPPDEQLTVYEVAKRLQIDVAMSIDQATFHRHVFAPRGTWSRR